MSTGDFMESGKELSEATKRLQSATKVLAVGAIFCAGMKMLLMFPVRPVKIFSIFFFASSVAGIAGYLIARYQLIANPAAVASKVWAHLLDANFFIVVALMGIALLFIASLLYPFTFKRWNKLVWTDR